MKVAICILVLLKLGSLCAQTNTQEQFDFFQGKKTTVKNPFDLRDPFKKLPFKRAAQKEKNSQMRRNNNEYSNLPLIDDIPLSQLKIVGVLLGTNRRALAKVIKEGGEVDKTTYMLKEGMKIGLDGAELKAILPGGIVVVEKIRNVYDQDEYLETVIPVSAE